MPIHNAVQHDHILTAAGLCWATTRDVRALKSPLSSLYSHLAFHWTWNINTLKLTQLLEVLLCSPSRVMDAFLPSFRHSLNCLHTGLSTLDLRDDKDVRTMLPTLMGRDLEPDREGLSLRQSQLYKPHRAMLRKW